MPRKKGERILTWKSHSNSIGVGKESRHFGVVFDRRGDLLDDLEPGNVFAVRICVSFPGWSNFAAAGTLTVKVLEEAFYDHGERRYTLSSTTGCNIVSEANELSSRIWFSTPALDELVVSKIEEVQLFTESHHQGYVEFREAGSWSWFNIVILESSDATTPKVMDGRSLVWASHTNKIGDEYSRHNGKIFTRDHELLEWLELIALEMTSPFACVPNSRWENHAKEGQLVVRITNRGPRKRVEHVDITEHVNLDIKLQKEINAIYADSYLAANDIGCELPPYVAEPAMMVVLSSVRRTTDTYYTLLTPYLSTDGGGVRGVSSLRILQEIMAEVAPNAKPYEYFDTVIAGTSTGGLIAIMLGRLQMTIEECAKEYESLSKEVFGAGNAITRGANSAASLFTGATYSASTLEACFKKLIKKRLGDENAKMYDRDVKCKVFVTIVRTDNAARATSAAPHYFDAMEINGVKFADGGLGYNNPAPELIREAHQCFGVAHSFQCILSIGTGMVPKEAFGKATLAQSKSFIQGLLAIATSCEKGHQILESFAPFLPNVREDKYHRFDFGVWLGKGGKIKFVKPWYNVNPWSKGMQVEDDWDETIAMDDWAKMGEYVKQTGEWLKGERQQIERCAARLRHKN
ncbi:acyl transferase/acyl hydrolase/lysophospholipase [Mycena rosella]|uniref:Acyl transferase/acyl hydrolase/lysophospholipase n=1 Tax=Mycena rosella TaxID=1033263 RepID=A0AAD7CXK4_MYCRO|nr:acyl transferase/acyl hydrolase/lysophospholipase [Mycena rosella]